MRAPAPHLLGTGGALPLAGLPAACAHSRAADDELIVGLRPEDLQLQAAAAEPGMLSIEAIVESIEPVGNEIFLTMQAAGHTITGRVPPQALPETGRPVRLHYRAERLRFFAAQSGERLL